MPVKTLYLILYVVAALCFALSAFGVGHGDARMANRSLVSLGLLAWVLVPLVELARAT